MIFDISRDYPDFYSGELRGLRPSVIESFFCEYRFQIYILRIFYAIDRWEKTSSVFKSKTYFKVSGMKIRVMQIFNKFRGIFLSFALIELK